MPIIRRSYLDLSPERRKEGARVARARLRGALGNPLLAPEQLKQLQAQMAKLDKWEAGTLPVTVPTTGSKVTLEDARSLGLCEPGIEEWCKAHGVDPKDGAPASVLVADKDRRARVLGRRVSSRK